jgi:hypothetical protein
LTKPELSVDSHQLLSIFNRTDLRWVQWRGVETHPELYGLSNFCSGWQELPVILDGITCCGYKVVISRILKKKKKKTPKKCSLSYTWGKALIVILRGIECGKSRLLWIWQKEWHQCRSHV